MVISNVQMPSLYLTLLILVISWLIITFIVNFSVGLIAGKRKKSLVRSAVVALLGPVVAAVLADLPLIGLILSLGIWIVLYRYIFAIGWIRSIIVAIVAAMIQAALIFVLQLLLAALLLITS